MSGRVTLVGAGPGAADLLTLRAVRALEQAEVVFYDALVSRETLDLAPRAQRFCVGKRAGRRSTRQETIHALLVRAARRGRRVVRLKGGDPFVFGRGGEEALALAAAGIPCEVVPGVSSAIAAPALCGIPATHRSLASAFVVVSGHAESAWHPVLASLPPRTATVIVLMGLAARAAIATRARRALAGRPRRPPPSCGERRRRRSSAGSGHSSGLATAQPADGRRGRPRHDRRSATSWRSHQPSALPLEQEERGEMHA